MPRRMELLVRERENTGKGRAKCLGGKGVSGENVGGWRKSLGDNGGKGCAEP